MYGTLTLGLGKFIFAGISAGIDLPSLNKNVPVYSFGGIFGLNLTSVKDEETQRFGTYTAGIGLTW